MGHSRSCALFTRRQPTPQESVLSTVSEWLTDVACNRNPTVLLIAGILYAHEANYTEALKACSSGMSLEL